MCDPTDPQLAVSSCTVANDDLGAEALVQNLQADIHLSHVGGVPDFLPFSDAASGALSFSPPYGDAAFIRSHYSIYQPDDVNNASQANEWVNTQFSSTRQGGSSALTAEGTSNTDYLYIDFGTEACTAGGPVQGTPANYGGTASAPTTTGECGGDAGGFILPVPTVAVPSTQTGSLQ